MSTSPGAHTGPRLLMMGCCADESQEENMSHCDGRDKLHGSIVNNVNVIYMSSSSHFRWKSTPQPNRFYLQSQSTQFLQTMEPSTALDRQNPTWSTTLLANPLPDVNCEVRCHILLIPFVYHAHLHKYLWFGCISSTVAYQYRKSIAVIEK